MVIDIFNSQIIRKLTNQNLRNRASDIFIFSFAKSID